MKMAIGLLLLCLSLSSIVCQHSTDFAFELTPKIVSQIPANSDLLKTSDKFGYSISGAVFFPISDKYQLKTGLSLSNLKLHQKDYSLGEWHITPNNSWYDLTAEFVSLGTFFYNRIYINRSKTSFFIEPGIELLLHLMVDGYSKAYFDGIYDPTLVTEFYGSPIQYFNVFGVLGIGVEFSLNDGKSIFLEPKVEYGFTQLFQDTSWGMPEINSRWFNLGLVVGVRI